MKKMIQIRHVPEPLHRKLKARAAVEGTPLSDYLLRAIRRLVEQPTLDEIKARLARRSSVAVRISPARAVRIERERP
jgi:plasmid stability protein